MGGRSRRANEAARLTEPGEAARFTSHGSHGVPAVRTGRLRPTSTGSEPPVPLG